MENVPIDLLFKLSPEKLKAAKEYVDSLIEKKISPSSST